MDWRPCIECGGEAQYYENGIWLERGGIEVWETERLEGANDG